MKKIYLTISVVQILISNVMLAQEVHIDNQTGCDYILDLRDDCANNITSGPYDAPASSQPNYSLMTSGIGSASDVDRIYVFDSMSGVCVISLNVHSCGSDTPIFTCGIECDLLPLKVNWWISGSDFYIVLFT